MEKKKGSLSLDGFPLFIDPYDCYFNIKSHHFMSNQRIFIGLTVMMNPYKQRLAFRLWFLGFRPLSVLQSHLPPLYFETSAWICPSSCDLALAWWTLSRGDLLVSLGSLSDRSTIWTDVTWWVPSQLSTSPYTLQVISRADTIQH